LRPTIAQYGNLLLFQLSAVVLNLRSFINLAGPAYVRLGMKLIQLVNGCQDMLAPPLKIALVVLEVRTGA
jgi:hypothetical protein